MKRLLFMLILTGLMPALFAQDAVRKGVVLDEAGMPLERVSVQIKGTTSGTFTDAKGQFSINSPRNSVLVFTMVGFLRAEVAAAAVDGDYSIRLTKNESQLTEVVVTALGVNRNRNQMPYAVQTIKGDEVARIRTPNFVQGLSGKIAGLNIQQGNAMGGSTNITLRGIRSITGDNQALFVVDGVPYANASGTRNTLNTTNSAQRTGSGGYDYGSTAADFNADDIETITVLKGAAASALYGSQGANGVILITTKKANRGLGVTFNAGGTLGMLDKSTFPAYQRLYGGGYGADKDDATGYFYEDDLDGDGQPDLIAPIGDDASYGHKFDPNLMVFQWESLYPGTPQYLKKRAWTAPENNPDAFFRKGSATNFSVFVDGGTDKGSFKLGLTRNDEKGIIENSRIQKNLVNISASFNPIPKLTVSAAANYTNIKGKGRWGTGYDGSEGKNIMTSLRQWWQTSVDILQQRDAYFAERKNRPWNIVGYDDLRPYYWDNPYWTIYENYQDDTRNRFFGNVSVNFKATEWLNVMARVAQDYYDELREERIAIGSTGVPKYLRANRWFKETNIDLLLNADKEIANGLTLKALLGSNIRKQRIENVLAETNGGLVVPGLYTLSNTLSQPASPLEYLGRREVQGIFGGTTLSYKDMLSLDLTLRRDVSSTLPKGANSYYYPSVSGGFTFSKLLPAATWLSIGKLRANYAQVGADAPISAVRDTYSQEQIWGPVVQYSTRSTKNNLGLKPERTESVEGGLELGFFDNRIGLDLTAYKTKTIDQIIPVASSAASGFLARYMNAGVVENKGLEISLTGAPVRTTDFSWYVTANWSANKNRVLSLPDGADNLQLASFQGNVTINAAIGQPFGIIRGTDYVYTNGRKTVDEDGRYLISPTTNNIIGNPNPEWLAGLNNQFRYKNFFLSFLVDMRKGGDVFSLDMYYGLSQGLYAETALVNSRGVNSREPVDKNGGVIMDGVTADGKENEIWVENEYGTYGDYYNPNKGFVYDASYVKLREAVFTYTLPKSLLSGIGFVKGLDLSLIGRNLWIIHKNLPHADPEDTLGSGNLQGYQSGSYPTTRTFTFNLKCKF
ncbi:SusC/RagA family TonB-linked outer membrane protein [Chitinophaga rhizosphaerae]|uniref:SusC/RagA family TonB-linked outer membrane protein n=1 Tax=Chitinophaga rhizosphaerae TaxID=1864947 RepID=UPI000F813872|nr:SusC/RagA family TonB-linked outer membrane protein [Chitinophaga rhizosphaerae]